MRTAETRVRMAAGRTLLSFKYQPLNSKNYRIILNKCPARLPQKLVEHFSRRVVTNQRHVIKIPWSPPITDSFVRVKSHESWYEISLKSSIVFQRRMHGMFL